MKHISIIASLLLLLGIGMTGCKEDTEPRLYPPTDFVLNTPPAADQVYVFRCDSKNNSLNDIELTVSQPDYGVGCVPDYQVQLAKSEEDFALWDQLVADRGQESADDPYLGADGLPLVSTLETIFTSARMNITGDVFCGGVNRLYGLDLENYNGETKDVAVRVHAWVPNASYSSILSNTINLKVSSYIPIPGPGVIYLVGNPQGWDINSEAMPLVETEIGSKIYYGAYSIEADKFQFRFYFKLGDWDYYSIGAQDEDALVDIALTNGHYEGPAIYDPKTKGAGKGGWQIPNWAGGTIEMFVDLNDPDNYKVTFNALDGEPEGRKMYLVGACNGWDINSDALYITETAVGSNIYNGTVNIAAGQFVFRFYSALGDWETNSIGSQADDVSELFSWTGDLFTGTVMNGKGKWEDPNWVGGDVAITLDLNANTVTFDKAK